MTADIISAVVCGVLGCAVAAALVLLCRRAVRAEENKVSSGECDERILRRIEMSVSHPARVRAIKGLRVAFSLLFYVLILGTAIFCVAASLTARSLGAIKMPVSMLAVASGSMSYVSEDNPYAQSIDCDEGFAKNSLIFLEQADTEEFAVNDIVAYVSDTGTIIIHRIVAVVYDGRGNALYTLCGDANSAADKDRVTADKIIGRYNGFSLGGVGAIVRFFNSYVGIVTAVLIVCAIAVCEWANARMSRAEDERVKILRSAQDEG